jgi:hypothetical protein
MAGMPINLDLAGLALTAGLTLAVYGAWLAALAHARRPLSEVALAAFLASIAHILAAEVALGLFGALTAPALAAVMAFSLGVLVWLAWRHRRTDTVPTRRGEARAAWADLRAHPAAVALIVLLSAWSAWTVFLGLIFPPYAFDEFLYHMPIAAGVIQTGSVWSIPSPAPWISAYPRYAELLAVWNSIFLGRDTLADLALLPQLWFCGLGVYVAARRLGAGRAWSIGCASVAWFAPVLLMQAKGSYNDIMIACMWAAGIAFALPPRRAGGDGSPAKTTWGDGVLTGLAAGLLIGTKITGLVFAAALAAVMLGRLMIERAPARSLMRCMIILGMVAFVTGSVWGWINLRTFGNPLYPASIGIGGREFLPGRSDLAALFFADEERNVAAIAPGIARFAQSWLERQVPVTIDARLAGLGPLWAVLGVPAVLLWMAWAIAHRDTLPLLVIGAHIALLITLPAAWVPRFSVFLLVLGGCALAGLAPALGRAAAGWATAVTVALAGFSLFASIDHGYFDTARIRLFAGLGERERTVWRWDPRSFGPAYQWIDQSSERGAVVAYGDAIVLPYALWGSGFERRVIHVPGAAAVPYYDAVAAAGADYAFLGRLEPKADALRADGRARIVIEDPGGGLVVFALRQP